MPPSLLLFLAAPMMTVPSAPIITPMVVSPSGDANIVTTFDVEIRGGREMLWSGQMRTSGRSSASFSRNKRDAPPVPCGNTDAGGSDRSSLSLDITPVRYSTSREGFQVNASWSRPGSGDPCMSERNSRTVGVSEAVTLLPGQAVTIEGDGGLALRIRRAPSPRPQ